VLPSLLYTFLTLFAGSTEEFRNERLKKEASSGVLLANAMPTCHLSGFLQYFTAWGILDPQLAGGYIQKNGKIQNFQPFALVPGGRCYIFRTR
jgi:hypothetical protein